jgi:dipeptide/tripeptide permease
MEWLVESINPLFIFIALPTLTAITKKHDVLTMMIVGTLVSACAPFCLAGGPSTVMLVGYFLVFSLGEAVWSARFYEYAAELAPPGRVAEYMGVALLPWFVAKTTTGFYSGWLLEVFVPKTGEQRSGTMWLIYGFFALSTPASLLVARRWVRSGMT